MNSRDKTTLGWKALCASAALALCTAAACQPLSERVHDASTGENGSFEHVSSGLPTNWLVYSPGTVPSGDFDLAFDQDDFREGAQSLKFSVRECSAVGGRYSPGIARELPAVPGATYTIGFWVKSEGCDWTVSVGGVDAKTAEYEVIESTGTPAGEWHFVRRQYVQPEAYDRMRFELSVRSAGTLWLDDVRIERSSEVSQEP